MSNLKLTVLAFLIHFYFQIYMMNPDIFGMNVESVETL